MATATPAGAAAGRCEARNMPFHATTLRAAGAGLRADELARPIRSDFGIALRRRFRHGYCWPLSSALATAALPAVLLFLKDIDDFDKT